MLMDEEIKYLLKQLRTLTRSNRYIDLHHHIQIEVFIHFPIIMIQSNCRRIKIHINDNKIDCQVTTNLSYFNRSYIISKDQTNKILTRILDYAIKAKLERC